MTIGFDVLLLLGLVGFALWRTKLEEHRKQHAAWLRLPPSVRRRLKAMLGGSVPGHWR